MRQAQKRTGKDGTRRRVQLYPIIRIVCGRTFTPRKVIAKTCSNNEDCNNCLVLDPLHLPGSSSK
jgi:hypothetical protein